MANMPKFLSFLSDNTKDMYSVCELGAGHFENFPHYRSRQRVGIELISSYIENRVPGDWVVIHGNALEFDRLLATSGITPDVFTLIDFLEHVEKDAGLDLLKRLQKVARRIIIFAPHGTCNQSGEESFGFGETSCAAKIEAKGEKEVAVEAQRHKSTWVTEDLVALGFTVDCDRNYHRVKQCAAQIGTDGGAVIFGVWNKNA
jgi:hypothetical protein